MSEFWPKFVWCLAWGFGVASVVGLMVVMLYLWIVAERKRLGLVVGVSFLVATCAMFAALDSPLAVSP